MWHSGSWSMGRSFWSWVTQCQCGVWTLSTLSTHGAGGRQQLISNIHLRQMWIISPDGIPGGIIIKLKFVRSLQNVPYIQKMYLTLLKTVYLHEAIKCAPKLHKSLQIYMRPFECPLIHRKHFELNVHWIYTEPFECTLYLHRAKWIYTKLLVNLHRSTQSLENLHESTQSLVNLHNFTCSLMSLHKFTRTLVNLWWRLVNLHRA